jgi:hypothetical protein
VQKLYRGRCEAEEAVGARNERTPSAMVALGRCITGFQGHALIKLHSPTDTAFKQQRLKAWQPILTPATVLPTFFLVGLIFVPLGGVLLWGSNQVSSLTSLQTERSREERARRPQLRSRAMLVERPKLVIGSERRYLGRMLDGLQVIQAGPSCRSLGARFINRRADSLLSALGQGVHHRLHPVRVCRAKHLF